MGKVIVGENDIATLYPDICKEWHPTKNGNLTPSQFTSGSHKRIWWLCSDGHEWESIISNRIRLGRSCPFCAGQRAIQGINDLETTSPELAKEWHPTKNGDTSPSDVMAGSHSKVWWMCDKGHEWKAQIKSRGTGVGCPYCSNKLVLDGFNDLASVRPEIAKWWHPTKNGSLLPSQVTYGSGKKVWWTCKNNHEYLASVDSRYNVAGCPVCAKRRRTSFPEQAFFFYIKQAFPDAINSYREIFPHSMELDIFIPYLNVGIEYDGKAYHGKEQLFRDNKKYNICKDNGIILIRVMEAAPGKAFVLYDRKIELPDNKPESLNWGISYLCCKLGKVVDVDVKRDRFEILSQFESIDVSLASERPDLTEEWNWELNEGLSPYQIHAGSNQRVWWRCKTCSHEWMATVSERNGRDNTGCPVCAMKRGANNRVKNILAKKGSLEDNLPELLKRWNYDKNDILPSGITIGSGKKVWWKCPVCNYEWESTIGHVKRTDGCPMCNRKYMGRYGKTKREKENE